MSVRIGTLCRLLLAATFLQISVSAPDFDKCFELTKNQTVFDDPSNHKYFSNRTDFPYQDKSLHYLNLDGCNHFCGTGSALYPVGAVVIRFAAFILPLLILSVAFSIKSDLRLDNVLFIFVHLVANPIDSLWSIFMRQEAARRNYVVAAELAPTASREIAAILTAYDQWWQDARNHFQGKFLSTRIFCGDGQDLDHSESAPLVTEGIVDQHQSAELNIGRRANDTVTSRDNLRSIRFHSSYSFHPKIFGKVKAADPSRSRRQEVEITRSLNLEEVHQIRYSAQRLAANRSSNLLRAWVAILIFLGSLAGGYYRAVYNYQSRQNSQTAHTLAVVMLFSFLIFAVYLNGHVGNFNNQIAVANTLRDLRKHSSSLSDIFPDFEIHGRPSSRFREFVDEYEQDYPVAGIINSWRPNKKLLSHDIHDRSPWAMLLVSFFAITASYAAALVVSYWTPTVGFGCRSLAWTCIWSTWVVNALLDIPGLIMTRKREKPSRKLLEGLWIFCWIRDAIFSLGIMSAVMLAQIGVYNTCWCRAGINLNPATVPVNIGPPTDHERDDGTLRWLVVAGACLGALFFCIFYAGVDGENGRLLFVRSLSESMAEQRGIQLEESRLGQRTDTCTQTAQKETVGNAQPETSDASRIETENASQIESEMASRIETEHTQQTETSESGYVLSDLLSQDYTDALHRLDTSSSHVQPYRDV